MSFYYIRSITESREGVTTRLRRKLSKWSLGVHADVYSLELQLRSTTDLTQYRQLKVYLIPPFNKDNDTLLRELYGMLHRCMCNAQAVVIELDVVRSPEGQQAASGLSLNIKTSQEHIDRSISCDVAYAEDKRIVRN